MVIDLKEITEKIGADAAAIMVPHPNEPFLFCKYSYNCPPEWDPLKNPLDHSTANGRVYLTGKSEVANHVDIELAGHYISSFIIVPIFKEDKVIANLEIITTHRNKSFPDGTQQIVETAAQKIAQDI